MNRLNKHVLAAYYSDARVNILHCLNDVREKTGLAPIKDEAQILKALADLSLSTATPERQQERIKLLRNRFRFIDPATDVQIENEKDKTKAPDAILTAPGEYDRLLAEVFELIGQQRNALVHPTEREEPIAPEVQRHLLRILGTVYDSALREITKRFSLESNAVEPLRRYEEKANPEPKSHRHRTGKYRTGKDREKRKHQLKSPEEFPLALARREPDNRESLAPSELLSDFARVLLCSLFLDKTQIAELADYYWNADEAKRWSAPERAIIREALGVYRVHLPVQRLQVGDTVTAVTIDTLSELSRCPLPLFETLSPADQDRFRIGDSLRDPTSDEPEEENEHAETVSALLVRSRQDRFATLMMRFFDFDPECRLRFAVDLGQYFYNVRLKPGDTFADDIPRVRRLARKALAYGRLADFDSAARPESWTRLVANHLRSSQDEKDALARCSGDIETLPPYVVACLPHYHYAEDRIGLRLAEPDAPAAYPDLPIAQPEADLRTARPSGRDTEPHYWMSPDQMLDFGLYAYLQKGDPRFQRLDVVLKRYSAGMARMLRELDSGAPSLDGAPRSPERRAAAQAWIDRLLGRRGSHDIVATLPDLPSVLVNWLLGADEPSVSAASVRERLASLIRDTEWRERQIEHLFPDLVKPGTKPRQPFKRGKKGFRPIKCGLIGDFLAEDLLRFQPADETLLDAGGGKLNSQQYQILQAALAYYGAHLDQPPRIVDLLHDAKLLEGALAHPFLDKLDKPDKYPGLLSFYHDYLKARWRFLTDYRERVSDNPGSAATPRWLRLRQRSTLDTWLKGYRTEQGSLDPGLQPWPIPRNLLYPPILAMVAQSLGVGADELCEQGTRRFQGAGPDAPIRPSTTWLLKRYLEGRGESSQAMYDYPRRHKLFDLGGDGRKSKSKTDPMPEAERAARLAEIRKSLTTLPADDPSSALQAETGRKTITLYERQERTIRRIRAQDMVLYLYAHAHLDRRTLLSDAASAPAWSLKNIDGNLLNTPIRYRLPIRGTARAVFHEACKIRNLGEVRLLARDRRLPSLSAYFPVSEAYLNQAEIRAELKSYRQSRVKALEQIHRLERAVHAHADGSDRETEIPAPLCDLFGSGMHGRMLYQLYDLHQRQPGGHRAGYAPADFAPELFDRARLIRNAFCHNEYPDAARFAEVAAAVAEEPVPDNPDRHRRVAARLLERLTALYSPWMAFLGRTSGDR